MSRARFDSLEFRNAFAYALGDDLALAAATAGLRVARKRVVRRGAVQVDRVGEAGNLLLLRRMLLY